MFDALDELEARDEDPTESKAKIWRFGIAFVIVLVVFAVIGLAMWQYHG